MSHIPLLVFVAKKEEFRTDSLRGSGKDIQKEYHTSMTQAFSENKLCEGMCALTQVEQPVLLEVILGQRLTVSFYCVYTVL